MAMTPGGEEVIYEVECTIDPEIVADFDAWLPGHVRAVTACAGFTGAEIQSPASAPGESPVRRTQYRLQDAAALQRYLEQDAPRMRADAAARFADKVSFTRRVLRPATTEAPQAEAAITCQNCGSAVSDKYCPECGQAGHMHLMTIGDVTHDVVHSVLHLDSRVWRTLQSLILKPGELTNEFIAGRRQRYLPPFRLYLIISVGFFALSAVLPDAHLVRVNSAGEAIVAPVTLDLPEQTEVEVRQQIEELAADPATPQAVRDVAEKLRRPQDAATDDFSVKVGWPWLDGLLEEAAGKLRQGQDGGKRLSEAFLANAPKLMFVFLPLMAAAALLFYWKPRRLYAEHLVLFLHAHAFLFLWLAIAALVRTVASLELPLIDLLRFVNFALFLYVPWYVYRAMRVVYGNGRALTAFKFVMLSGIYFVLLGMTMLVGIVYSMLAL